jgi:hypothetical protein
MGQPNIQTVGSIDPVALLQANDGARGPRMEGPTVDGAGDKADPLLRHTKDAVHVVRGCLRYRHDPGGPLGQVSVEGSEVANEMLTSTSDDGSSQRDSAVSSTFNSASCSSPKRAANDSSV